MPVKLGTEKAGGLLSITLEEIGLSCPVAITGLPRSQRLTFLLFFLHSSQATLVLLAG